MGCLGIICSARAHILLHAMSTKPVIYIDNWIIDSSCSNRMTGDKEKLINLTEYKGIQLVVTADNFILPITHIDNMVILPQYNT